MAAILHRSHIAHRDLRTANLLLDADGAIWLVDFAVADLTASDEVRDTVADRTQAPETELPRLSRFDRRTAISMVVLGVAIAALLPQLSRSGDVWAQIPRADPMQLAMAAVFSFVTYMGAALAIHGASPGRLPVVRSFVAQLASSFVNRVAPARVGGMALNVRWLVKEGLGVPVAGAVVSLNAIGGFVMHAVLTLFVVLWAGRAGLGTDLEMISPRMVGLALGLVAVVLAVSYAVPPLRRALHHRVWPRTRESLDAVVEATTSSRRVALLLGGSLLVTSASIAALSVSISAVGASLPVVAVALVYLGGTAVASAAPTPGGLGATEAALAAGLAAMGLDQGTAIAAVLLYRLVTF